MADTNRHLSYYQLEAIIMGRLDRSAHPEIDEHLKVCSECSLYLEKAPNNSAFLKMKFPTFEALHRSRSSAKQVKESFFTSFYKPAFVFFSLILFVSVFYYSKFQKQNDLSIKGGDVVFRLLVNGNEAVATNDTVSVSTGDTLLLTLTAAKSQFYYIAYRDDGKNIEFYFPTSGNAPIAIGATQGEPLPNYIVLGGGWKTEELFCLAMSSPISVDSALALIRKGLSNKIFILSNRNP